MWKHLFQFLIFVTILEFGLSDTDKHRSTLTDKECEGRENAKTLLDGAKDSINEAKNLYPNCNDDDINSGKKDKSFAFLDIATHFISEIKKNYPACPDSDSECPNPQEKPMDCSEVLKSGQTQSGVYMIWPKNRIYSKKPIPVYCDMDTDGGGWIVIQRRGNYSNPKDYFFKDWQSYKTGFGNIKEEFWIGNDNMYAISNQAPYTVRIDLEDTKGETAFAQYDTFWIEDEFNNYTLHINGYSGNAGDSMGYHNNMKFSTKDRKNDKHTESCAILRHSGFWFKKCSYCNPNGLNKPGVKDDAKNMHYSSWRSLDGLAVIEIKLRRL